MPRKYAKCERRELSVRKCVNLKYGGSLFTARPGLTPDACECVNGRSMLALRIALRAAAPTAKAAGASRLCSILALDHEPRPQEVVLNVSGPDRVGVVHDIAQRIVNIGGNVGESQAITVKGTFVAAFAISVDVRADLPEFCQSVTNALPDFNVSLLEAVRVPESAMHTAHFVVSMADHLGAVHEVTGVFAEQQLSVVALKTTHERTARGAEIFGMQGTLSSSERAIDVSALSDALEAVEHRCGIEVEVYVNPPGPAPQELFPFRNIIVDR